jgi:hypothetical protein
VVVDAGGVAAAAFELLFQPGSLHLCAAGRLKGLAVTVNVCCPASQAEAANGCSNPQA